MFITINLLQDRTTSRERSRTYYYLPTKPGSEKPAARAVHPPLYLEEFQDRRNPPLDTSIIMLKSQYSFFKRKNQDLNARTAKAITDSRRVVQLARELFRRDRAKKSRTPARVQSRSSGNTSHAFSTSHKSRCCSRQAGATCASSARKRELEAKSFRLNQNILDSNRVAEQESIYRNHDLAEADYASKVHSKAKWGSSGYLRNMKINVFGRRAKRGSSFAHVPKYSRDSLERLAVSDMRLYTESEQKFKDDYAYSVVEGLLMQTNQGAKYRRAVDFESTPLSINW